jgi:ADP-heptose:LPS heptosyltransferase
MSPVVEAVHRSDPAAHVTLVVGARATALFQDDPRVHTLVDANRFDSALGRLKLALTLWRYHPQVVVDLRHTLYPLLLKPLACWRYLRQPPREARHMRERHLWKLRLQAPRAAASADTDGSVWLSPRDVAHADHLWNRWRLERGKPLIIICPGARSHIKRWTAEGFARVADRLMAEAGAQVVFSGEPDEEPVIEEVLQRMDRRAHSAVGLTTIRQLGALMRRAQLVITNDSASLHLASAVGAPTIALFGPTDAGKYGPTAPAHRTIRRALFCAPCEQAACRFNHECMRFVGPDEVMAAARDLLTESTSQK